MSNRDNRRLAFWASVALVATMPMVVWWLVGDLSEPNGDIRFVTPISVSPFVEALFGWGSLLLTLWSGSIVWNTRTSFLLCGDRWRVLLRALVIGVLAASGARILTAAVGGGGPIGAGFVLFFGLPVLLYNAARTYEKAVQIRVDNVAPGWTPSTVEWLWARRRWRQ